MVQVGVHSALANKIAQTLLQRKEIPSLLPYNTVSAEVNIKQHLAGASRKRSLSGKKSQSVPAASRLDFQLQQEDSLTFVEVKSVTMAQCVASPPQSILSVTYSKHIISFFAGALSGKKMALFPDTVRVHLACLSLDACMRQKGHRAIPPPYQVRPAGSVGQ